VFPFFIYFFIIANLHPRGVPVTQGLKSPPPRDRQQRSRRVPQRPDGDVRPPLSPPWVHGNFCRPPVWGCKPNPHRPPHHQCLFGIRRHKFHLIMEVSQFAVCQTQSLFVLVPVDMYSIPQNCTKKHETTVYAYDDSCTLAAAVRVLLPEGELRRPAVSPPHPLPAGDRRASMFRNPCTKAKTSHLCERLVSQQFC